MQPLSTHFAATNPKHQTDDPKPATLMRPLMCQGALNCRYTRARAAVCLQLTP